MAKAWFTIEPNFYNWIGALVLLGMSFTAASCGFKKPVAAVDESLAPAAVSVSWEKTPGVKSPSLTRALTVKREEKRVASLSSLTLPSSAPDGVTLTLSLPTPLLGGFDSGVRVLADALSSVAITGSRVLSQSQDLTVVEAQISGLRKVLPDLREAAATLALTLTNSKGETLVTVEVALRTPPALVKITQSLAADSDLPESAGGKAMESFVLGDKHFVLVSVVKAENLSKLPVQIEVPIASDLKLTRLSVSHVRVAEGECGNLGWDAPSLEPLATDTRLFILSDDLPKTLTQLERDPSSVTTTSARIESGASVFVGAFVAGESAVQTVASGKYELKKPASVDLPERCEAQCAKKRMGAGEFPLCWAHYEYRMGVTEKQINDCIDCGNNVQSGCESCRAWEVSQAVYLRAGPNCLFCGELAVKGNLGGIDIEEPIPEWQLKPVTESFPVGEEDVEISLTASPESAPMKVRFADQSVDQDPETRALPFLSSHFALVKEGEGL